MNQRYVWIFVGVLPVAVAVACGDDSEASGDEGMGGTHASGNGGTRPTAGAPPLTTGGGGSGGRGPDASGGVQSGGVPEPGAGRAAGGSPAVAEAGAAGASGSVSNGGETFQGGAGGTPVETAGAGGDGGTAGMVAHLGEDVYVDPVGGDDGNEGTRLEPFKTVAHASAAALSRRSETIWLRDGIYDSSTEPKFAGSASGECGQSSGVTLPAGISIRAEHAGEAELVVSGYHGLCMAGGRVSGLALRRTAPGGQLLASTAGSLVIEGTTFADCGLPGVVGLLSATQRTVQACVIASGDAEVSLAGDRETVWTAGSLGTFVVARDDARVELDGGKFSFAPSANTVASFAAGERAGLALADLELTSSGGIAAQVQDGVSLSWLASSVRGFSVAARCSTNGANVLIDDVVGVDNQYFVYVNTTSAQASDLTLRNVRASGADAAVLVQSGAVELTLEDAELRDNAAGILFSGTGALTIEGSRIVDNEDGVRTLTSAGTYSVRMRNVEIAGNTKTGLLLGGLLQGTYDLGTVTDPGNNRFTSNAAGVSGGANVIVAGGQPIVVSAVGNRWDASEQGASEDGQYSVSGAGAKLDVTGGAGSNYRVLLGPTVIRLAENL